MISQGGGQKFPPIFKSSRGVSEIDISMSDIGTHMAARMDTENNNNTLQIIDQMCSGDDLVHDNII